MKFDFIAFCEDHGIDYRRPGEHHHVTEGWIGIDCPWCDTTGKFHLGYHQRSGSMNCWRCGVHSLKEYLQELFPDSYLDILRRYKKSVIIEEHLRKKEEKETVQMPYGVTKLLAPHRQYLRKRGFDPSEIELVWKVRATSGIAEPQWKWRLIIPVYQNGELVAVQGRDITGKRKDKYRSRGEVKRYVYNIDNIEGDSVIVTEGVFDAWRIGIQYAVATFGTALTKTQILTLAKRFKFIYILFDNDRAGQGAAQTLAQTLEFSGRYVEIIKPFTDAAEMKKEEIESLIKAIWR